MEDIQGRVLEIKIKNIEDKFGSTIIRNNLNQKINLKNFDYLKKSFENAFSLTNLNFYEI